MNLTEEMALQIAGVTHEANRVYCESLGDESQFAWPMAPQWQKDSVVLGVKGVILDGRNPEQSHESWLAHKIAEGWVYGPVKDPAAKTHPCLKPYGELSDEQKEKDHLFVSIVRLMAEVLDIEDGRPAEV
jgi:hypothetical protein